MSDLSRTHFRTCSLCEAMCGLEVEVKDGQVERIKGDKLDPFSRGFICPKGAVLDKLHTDPDRLRRPMVKDGDGQWREVDWSEAFDAVAKGLGAVIGRGDRNAVGVYLGNPNVHNLDNGLYMRPLLKSLGTRNVFTASTVDQIPRHVSCGLMYGGAGLIPVPDLDRTAHLLMLGANPLVSNGSLCSAPDFPGRLKALRQRGGRLVVVDPRRTRTAERADEHLFIRPGTDAFFLTAMIHTLFEEGLVDEGSLGLVQGVDAVRSAVAPLTPEAVASVCGVEAQTIRRQARDLAAAPSAAVYGRIGNHATVFGTLTSWAADVLNILTGNLDRPGGVMFPQAAHMPPQGKAGGRGFALGRWRSRVRGWPEAMGELPVATLSEEIEVGGPGQLRALVTVAGNPARSTPNSARLEKALSTLEFMVSVDPYLNETTRHADVILPPPSHLERPHYDLAFTSLAVRNVARFSEALFEAQGPSESEILSRLTLIAAGQPHDADTGFVDGMMLMQLASKASVNPASPAYGKAVPEMLQALDTSAPGPLKVLDLMLRTGAYGDGFGQREGGLGLAALRDEVHGMDLGALEPALPRVLKTPSGCVEAAPKEILGDLERLKAELGRASSAGGMVLIGRRHLRSNNSWMHNTEVLVRGKARCTLLMNPEDAQRLGFESGEVARVASRVGSVEAPVEISDGIMAGVVSLPHGWGHDGSGTRLGVASRHAGVNSNVLTDDMAIDPLSGNAALNAIAVTVSRCN